VVPVLGSRSFAIAPMLVAVREAERGGAGLLRPGAARPNNKGKPRNGHGIFEF
jgi:hypothetical protein